MQKTPPFLNIIRFIAISLFLTTFFSIFFSVFFEGNGIFFFIMPMFFLTFIFFVIMIISTAFFSMKTGMQSMGPVKAFDSMFSSRFNTLAVQAGYSVTLLPINHPSKAQYVLDHPTGKLLVKVLSMKEKFSNEVVQTLSGSLLPLQAKEGWVVSLNKPFLDNDQSYARFYNVLLYTMDEAMIVLGTKK